MHLKICGATTATEIRAVAAGGADLVGLWYGVGGAGSELSAEQVRVLAGHAAEQGIRPVLVTFRSDVAQLNRVLTVAGIGHLQLHGYQPPSTVRALKRDSDVVVIKALHVCDGAAQEAALVPAYERAGVDVFLIDPVVGDRLGSTGRQLPETDVLTVADSVNRPFWLAGGLAEYHADRHRRLVHHPHLAGIDVDSRARGLDGRLDRRRITSIARSWPHAPAKVLR